MFRVGRSNNHQWKGYGPSDPVSVAAVLELCPPRAQALIRGAGSSGGSQFWEAVNRSEVPVYGLIHVPRHEFLGPNTYMLEVDGRIQYDDPQTGTPPWLSPNALANLSALDVFPVKTLMRDAVILMHEVNVVYDVLAMIKHRYPLLEMDFRRNFEINYCNAPQEVQFVRAPALVCRTLSILYTKMLTSFGGNFCCAQFVRGTSDFEGLYFYSGFPTLPNVAASIIHHATVVREDSFACVDPDSKNGSQTITERMTEHRRKWNATMCVTPWLDNENEDALRDPCPQIREIFDNFLMKCRYVQAPLDLAPLRNVIKIGSGFLSGCSGLRYIDLSPLVSLLAFGADFLKDCSGLQYVALEPLFPAIESQGCLPSQFMMGCSGLRKVDFSSLKTDRPGGIPSEPRVFYGCLKLEELLAGPIKGINVREFSGRGATGSQAFGRGFVFGRFLNHGQQQMGNADNQNPIFM